MKNFTFVLFFCITCASCAQVSSPAKIPTTKQLDSLRTELEVLFRKDQTFRRIYVEAEEKLGKDSFEMEYFWEVVEAQDKVFEKKLTTMVDTYGWLGISQVGRLANAAQWTILQHGTNASKEKYGPLLKASVLKNESQPNHYARMIDRMLVNANKPQIYGSQINYDLETPAFYEIKDPAFVNQRRAEIGLTTIQEFANSKNIPWTIAQE